MSYDIYTVDEFACRLSELAIGTKDAQQLLDFVNRLERRNQRQNHRLRVAAEMLGHSIIEEALMDE